MKLRNTYIPTNVIIIDDNFLGLRKSLTIRLMFGIPTNAKIIIIDGNFLDFKTTSTICLIFGIFVLRGEFFSFVGTNLSPSLPILKLLDTVIIPERSVQKHYL